MSIFQEDISERIWDIKYRYRLKGTIVDQTIEDSWRRVATAVAQAEPLANRQKWAQAFYDLLQDFRFLPGGRILAGAGTAHRVTLFNCFVMPLKEDSLQGVFDALREAALTLQEGGGVGYDFSSLRPRGMLAEQVGARASGPVPFLQVWDAMCATIESSGARRGAMMGVLRCDHPDIETFLAARADPKGLRHFNLAVLVSDAFMQAVREDREWELLFPAGEGDLADTVLRHWSASPEPVACRVIRTLKARDLWDRILRTGYDFAEPGILFEDTINRLNNLWYREWISAANPHAEMPLPMYGVGNLGSLNLPQFVRFPFTEKAALDWEAIDRTVSTATRFLDNVVDISHFPFPPQRQEALTTRRIGLGITGLADMLVMLGIAYGSEASYSLVEELMRRVATVTWQSSIELAREKGVFSAFHGKKYVLGHFVANLPEEIRFGIEKYGIRNSHHNAIAPAESISLLANNVSPGIEPHPAGQSERTVCELSGEKTRFKVNALSLELWRRSGQAGSFPPAFVARKELTPEQHLRMQSVLQPWVDNAIAKTLWLPQDFPFEKLGEIYHEAHRKNLKGCMISRAGSFSEKISDESTGRHEERP